jgi:hypothetical protein
MNINRLIPLALCSLLLSAPVYLAAQDDQSQGSVADAARRAQAEKKTAPKAKLTIDNDNLGTLTGTINVVGESPASPDDQSKKEAEDKTKAGAPGEKKAEQGEAYWREKFAAANKKLTDDAHELDIDQREFNLKQEQYYADPMAALKQDYSRQDINDSRAKIDTKTADVAQDKVDISNLEDELRQAGGDPGWARPLDQPAQEQPAAPPAMAPAPDHTPAPATSPVPQQ